jgi:hypothetical protein
LRFCRRFFDGSTVEASTRASPPGVARTAEIDDRAGPRPTESVAPSVLVRATPTPQDDDTGTATISLRFDTQMLSRVDAAAKRLGISHTVWLHLAAGELSGDRR